MGEYFERFFGRFLSFECVGGGHDWKWGDVFAGRCARVEMFEEHMEGLREGFWAMTQDRGGLVE